MNQKTRLLRNALNLALKCNNHPDLCGEVCMLAFGLAEEIAWSCSPVERHRAIESCSDPDTALEVMEGRIGSF